MLAEEESRHGTSKLEKRSGRSSVKGSDDNERLLVPRQRILLVGHLYELNKHAAGCVYPATARHTGYSQTLCEQGKFNKPILDSLRCVSIKTC